MTKPKRKAKKQSELESKCVAAVALDQAITQIRALAMDCARMTDKLNGLNKFFGHMIMNGQGDLIGWTDQDEK